MMAHDEATQNRVPDGGDSSNAHRGVTEPWTHRSDVLAEGAGRPS